LSTISTLLGTLLFIFQDSFFNITGNVLQLGEVADLEALTFNLALMFIRIPNVQFSTEPAILPNCCACCTTQQIYQKKLAKKQIKLYF
jgi:hypothetical protein